jgi:16S rRNA (cytidine1402-2'-O)-methyltransferase
VDTGSTLYIVATPIGNLEDISHRAIRVLGEVDVLACEDTRRTRILLERYEIPKPGKVISYREENEKASAKGLIKLLEEGKTVAVVSDAGYPGISDAGYRLITEAIEKGIRLEIIPGAGAVEVALLMSGLPTDSYTFLGFLPKKGGPRKRILEAEKDRNRTIVIFESPLRLAKLLEESIEIFGDRRAAVCIELTKMFEEVHRGWLTELVEKFRDMKIKGEVTVVIAGNNKKFIRKEDGAIPD